MTPIPSEDDDDQACRCGFICWRVGGTAACGQALPPLDKINVKFLPRVEMPKEFPVIDIEKEKR